MRRGFVRGIVTGSLAGVALGLWLSPRIKPETRQMLRDRGLALAGKTGDTVEAVTHSVRNYLHREN